MISTFTRILVAIVQLYIFVQIYCAYIPIVFFLELPVVSEDFADGERTEVVLHRTHLTGCRGGEDILGREEYKRPPGALPGSTLPHGGLQSVSFMLLRSLQ